VVTNLSVYPSCLNSAFVFVPSVFVENIPTAEFGMIISTNCLLGHRKKIANFLMRTFTFRSTFLYDSTVELHYISGWPDDAGQPCVVFVGLFLAGKVNLCLGTKTGGWGGGGGGKCQGHNNVQCRKKNWKNFAQFLKKTKIKPRCLFFG
jgi:hypothetical protein